MQKHPHPFAFRRAQRLSILASAMALMAGGAFAQSTVTTPKTGEFRVWKSSSTGVVRIVKISAVTTTRADFGFCDGTGSTPTGWASPSMLLTLGEAKQLGYAAGNETCSGVTIASATATAPAGTGTGTATGATGTGTGATGTGTATGTTGTGTATGTTGTGTGTGTTGTGTGTTTTPAAASSASTVKLTAIEVTQGLQNRLNEMKLAKNRETFVVAHVYSLGSSEVAGQKVELVVTRAGGTPEVIRPINPDLAVVPASDEAAKIGQRLNSTAFIFPLTPSSYAAGGELTLKVQAQAGSKPLTCAEVTTTAATKTCSYVAKFTETYQPLNVKFLLGPQSTVEHAQRVAKSLKAMLPVSEVNFTTENWSAYDGPVITSSDTSGSALAKVHARWVADGKPKQHYAGLFYTASGGRAKARMDAPVFVAAAPFNNNGNLMAHEFAHTFGMGHGYDEPGNPRDPKFPSYLTQAGSQLSAAADGDAAYRGFVINDGWFPATALPYSWRGVPNRAMHNGGDITSGGYWTSEYVWNRILARYATGVYVYP